MATTIPNGDKDINDQFDFFKTVQLTDDGSLLILNSEVDENNLTQKQILNSINLTLSNILKEQKLTNKLLNKIYNPQ